MARSSGREELVEEVRQFLFKEADLLDEGLLRDWLQLLTEDVTYTMPLRVTREKAAGAGFVPSMAHLHEDRYTLEMRVRRLETEYAWAEDPPSRTRHFVTNIQVFDADRPDEVRVKSNVLVYRTRGDSPTYDVLSAVRHDVLRRANGQWRLASRTVYLDHSPVTTHNLAILI